MMLSLLQEKNSMGTVLQIKSEAYSVQDIDDVLELIRNDMGDDIYYYVQDYIDELKQGISKQLGNMNLQISYDPNTGNFIVKRI